METLTAQTTQTKFMTEKNKGQNSDILFIIAKIKNLNFEELCPYDINMCGRKMWEWVALAGKGCEIKTVSATEESDILSIVKPLLNEKPYTAIFYSDTPLLTRQNFVEMMDYFKYKGLSVLKLPRGYIFKTSYLVDCNNVLAPANTSFEQEQFLQVTNCEQLEKANNIIRNRIFLFHLKNKVKIMNLQTTFIDADVIIESGTVIEPNNHIHGICYIGKNVKLNFGNMITNSIISSGCTLTCSYVENSKITENKTIGPFEKIINKKV